MKNKMRIAALVLCALMFTCFSGCKINGGAAENTTSAAPTTTAPTESTTAAPASEANKDETMAYDFNRIQFHETRFLETEEGVNEEVVLATATVRFPSIVGDTENIMNINSYYENILEEQTIYFREEFYLMACDAYDFARENESEFAAYYMRSDFWAACNDDEYFSVVRSHTEFNGGSAEHTTLACETFDKKTGALVVFPDLFAVEQEEYMRRLTAIMTEQAEGKADLYENYPQLLTEKFDERDFYIHKDAETGEMFLVIVYQPYDIAPNSVGIVDFFINMEDIKDILK